MSIARMVYIHRMLIRAIILQQNQKKTYDNLLKEPDVQQAFTKMGTRAHQDQAVRDVIENFTCKLYKTDAKTVNLVRVQLFTKAFKAKKGNFHS